MKLKFYSKWVLLVCFISFQHSSLWSQISFDPIIADNNIGYIYNDFRYLYIAGNENSMSIREASDLKFSFSRKIKTNQINYDDYYLHYPFSSYIIPERKADISNFNLGYSPLPHLYGTASLFLIDEQEGDRDPNTNIIMGDLGIGTYYLKKTNNISFLKNKLKKLSKFKMTNRGLLMNALVGYSRGLITYTPTYKAGKGQFRLNRIYGKIGLDYQAGFFGIATDAKFGVLNYGKTTIEGHAYEDLIAQSALLIDKNDFMFGELSFRFYVGMKFGQIYINGIKTKVNDKMKEFVLSDFTSVGVVLDIQEIFKKKIKHEK